MEIERSDDGKTVRYGLTPDEATQAFFATGHGSFLRDPIRPELAEPLQDFFEECENQGINPAQSKEYVWVSARSRELLARALQLALTAPDGDVARITEANPPYRPDSIDYLEATARQAMIENCLAQLEEA